MGALLCFPRTARRRFSGIRVVLDAVVAAASLLFSNWATVLGPLLASGGSGLAQLVGLAYPAVDVVVASLVLTLGIRVPTAERRPWFLFGSGLVVLAVTDSIYVSPTAAGHTGITGSPLVAVWIAAFLLVALGAARPTMATTGPRPQFSVVQEVLPFAPVLAAVVVASAFQVGTEDTFLLVNGALVLLVLAGQQLVVAFEKVRLADGLEAAVGARTSELRAEQERTQAIIATATDAFIALDARGDIVEWNEAAERTFGWTWEEAIGCRLADRIIAERHREHFGHRPDRVAAGLDHDVLGQRKELEAQHRDGRELLVELTSWRAEGDGGFNAFERDITAQRQAELELATARDQALEGSRAKSEFLATMSHEIRTPMNGVIGLTGLLLETPLDETQRRYAKGVRGAGQALLGIIDDILSFFRLEAGKVELEHEAFDPRQLVEEVGVLVATTAADKGLELLAFCEPDVPVALLGDAGRLRQVLINLVSNAVKFTAAGEVVLRTRTGADQDGAAVVEFSVRDTGIGIAGPDQARLFDPFSQADASTTRRFGGTGLGLAICRRLAEAMDGELRVESELGAGSAFLFTVPLGSCDTAEPAPPSVALGARRVIVVDDNATNRLILHDQLTAWELRPETAEDAGGCRCRGGGRRGRSGPGRARSNPRR